MLGTQKTFLCAQHAQLMRFWTAIYSSHSSVKQYLICFIRFHWWSLKGKKNLQESSSLTGSTSLSSLKMMTSRASGTAWSWIHRMWIKKAFVSTLNTNKFSFLIKFISYAVLFTALSQTTIGINLSNERWVVFHLFSLIMGSVEHVIYNVMSVSRFWISMETFMVEKE